MRRTAAARAAAAGCAGGGPASAMSTVTAGAPPRGPGASVSRTVRGPSGVARVTAAPRPSPSICHRRQLGDAVRAQRAPQVDGLAAGAAQRDEGHAHRAVHLRRHEIRVGHPAAMRATPASVATAPASWCGAMRSRSTPNASSTVTTG